jgi:hypothetical protein
LLDATSRLSPQVIQRAKLLSFASARNCLSCALLLTQGRADLLVREHALPHVVGAYAESCDGAPFKRETKPGSINSRNISLVETLELGNDNVVLLAVDPKVGK